MLVRGTLGPRSGFRAMTPARTFVRLSAGTDGVLEDVDEIDAGFDVRDIDEDRGGAESGAKVVEQPAGMPGAIFTPVADEDGGRDPPS